MTLIAACALGKGISVPCGSSVHVWKKPCGDQRTGPGISRRNAASVRRQDLFGFVCRTLAYEHY